MSATRRSFLAATALGASAFASAGAGGMLPLTTASEAGLAGDGTTDDAPAIQAAYDAGGTGLALEAGRTYLLNSPIFLDRADPYALFTIQMNGAAFALGAALPRTDAFWRDKTTRWAFFPNTRRRALGLGSGTVDVTQANRATGSSVGAIVSLVLRDGSVSGGGANVGLVFCNRTAVRLENVVQYGVRAMLSWTDYCDGNILIGCYNRSGGPEGSVLVEQISNGDGLLMLGCKADSPVGLARLKYCRGAEFTAIVSGRIELDACSGIHLRAVHEEGQNAKGPMLVIRNSHVHIDTSIFYTPRTTDATTHPSISIDDSAGESHSELTLEHCMEMRYPNSGDQTFGSFIGITGAMANTRVTAHDLSAQHVTAGTAGVWTATAGPRITGDGDLGSVLAASNATVASGSFSIERRGGAWRVIGLDGDPGHAAASPAVPKLAAASGATEVSGAALAQGSRPTYRVAARNAAGTRSAASTRVGATVSSRGSVRLSVTADAAPCELLVWRFANSTTATPQAYVSVPCGRPEISLLDTGTRVSGYAWQTSGIPAVS
ncbi:hypothetical protein BJ978_000120 [Agromyces terreus]|uniref:Pectate lyase superfamily protein domain-containing protein n=1 Tax=Agromyces terreus TaxID=424795 RepID=A0A9X2KAD9_9MICO|nr:hypothetical protein [Agromyces terreus]MCP2369444.1 hypothetical protein [Agromyces terreus]